VEKPDLNVSHLTVV